MDKETAIEQLKLFQQNYILQNIGTKKELFKLTYTVSLLHCMINDEDYAYTLQCHKNYFDTLELAQKMINGIIHGSASNSGKALKLTCKQLGIKSTYKDMKNFLNS